MKLITKEIERKLKKFPIYSQDGKRGDAQVIAKYFHTWKNCYWFVLGGEQLPDGDWEFFGIAHIHEWEYGFFRLSDLKKLYWIEREIYGKPGTVREELKYYDDVPDFMIESKNI